VALLPFRSPAPLIYTPGEGWYYEPFGENCRMAAQPRQGSIGRGGAGVHQTRNYSLALHAAHRVVRVWPLSDYAPHAPNISSAAASKRRQGRGGVRRLQVIIEKYPKSDGIRGSALASI
jgi:hypothetical protein